LKGTPFHFRNDHPIVIIIIIIIISRQKNNTTVPRKKENVVVSPTQCVNNHHHRGNRPLVLFPSLFRTRTPFLAHSFIPFNPSQRSRNHFRVFRFVVNIMSLFCDVDARRCWRFDDEKDQNC